MSKTEKRIPALRMLLSTCGVLGAAALVAGTLLASTARFLWLGELMANLRFPLGVGGIGAALLLWIDRRPFVASGTALIAGLHLAPTLLLAFSAPPPQMRPEVREEGTLRVAALNLWMGNVEPLDVWTFVEREDIDVLALSEVSREWPQVLESWRSRFPHQAVVSAKPYGIALLSRFPIEDPRVLEPPHQSPPWDTGTESRPDSIQATLHMGETPITFIVAHPQRPGSTWRTRARNSLVNEIARAARAPSSARGRPIVVLGDLNMTGYSPTFGDLLEAAALEDSRVGFGRLPSWGPRRGLWGSWLALDHVLVRGVEVIDRRSGPYVGGTTFPSSPFSGWLSESKKDCNPRGAKSVR